MSKLVDEMTVDELAQELQDRCDASIFLYWPHVPDRKDLKGCNTVMYLPTPEFWFAGISTLDIAKQQAIQRYMDEMPFVEKEGFRNE